MIAYVVRRVFSAAGVLIAVSILVFLIFFKTPGVDPARQIAGKQATPQVIEQIRADFGLDKPLPEQYFAMMKRLVIDRDLVSYTDRGPVLSRVAKTIPVTLSLVAGAAVIWLLLALGAGTLAAVFRGRAIDPLLMGLGLVGMSLPVYWLGGVVNMLTQGSWHNSLFSWLPELGYTPINVNPLKWFEQLLFPWITLAIGTAGLYARVLRADLIEVDRSDFVLTARAKGLSESRVLLRHVLRNSLIPFVSLFGLDLGAMLGGAAVLTEQVFGLPGVGNLTFHSLSRFDLPVLMAVTLYGAFTVVLVNLLVDLGYAALDPRIRVR
ncbi:ABC transporter permease [Amycolatopsis sp. NPDC004079]|uniref:ABC transporter permease n=1 Tax=Amycolatopsis sp. NPDC004079 TaxID=3154549 RepID=UPI0033AAE6BB